MGFLASIIAFALCAFVYVRMIRREVPEQIGKAQAWVPIAVGIAAPLLSTAITLLTGLLIFKLRGGDITGMNATASVRAEMNPLLTSLRAAFVTAGFPEELVKLLLALLLVKIFKPKNVYEYALIFTAVGAGFTVLEEALYSGGGFISLGRLVTFAMHMVLGLVMGVALGHARYVRQHGGSAGKYILLGLLLPLLWHTIYDAGTATNAGFNAADENVQGTAIIAGAVVLVASVVLQIVLLIRFKKNAVAYSEMILE
ncbi:MAG: PrsW family intramembrane metalloprotease [Oscillospiraceae bacterium]|nr:PrsW family intramembrane metalloprotease [Oscillospiraceae bacterium]